MTPDPAGDRRRFGRLVHPLAATVGVGFGAILDGFSVLVTAEAAGAVWSATQLSAAFSGSVLTGALVAIPVGRHADRHGIRGTLALTGALALAVAVLEATQVHRIARFEATGFDPGVLALWAGAASLLSLPGRFVLPRLANRWPSPRLLTAVLAGCLVASVALVVVAARRADDPGA